MTSVQPTETAQITLIKLYQLRHQCQNPYQSLWLPWQWLRHLRTKTGQPDMIAALILADVLQWWTPELDSGTGNLRPKFENDFPQLHYADYVEKAGWTLPEVHAAFDRLESEGLITRILRPASGMMQLAENSHLQSIQPQLKPTDPTVLMFVDLHLEQVLLKLGLPALKLQLQTTEVTSQDFGSKLPVPEPRSSRFSQSAAPIQPRHNTPIQSPHRAVQPQSQPDQLGLMVKMGQGQFVKFDNPELQTIHIAIVKRKLPEWRDRIFPSYQQYLEYIHWLLQSTQSWSQPCQDPQAYARKVILDLWNGKGHPSWAKFVDNEPPIEPTTQLNFDELFTVNTYISNEEKLRQAALQAGFDDVFP